MTDDYGGWVRDILEHLRANPDVVGLADSSVPTPVDLLADLVDRYGSAIVRHAVAAPAWGNADLIGALAARAGVAESRVLPTTRCLSAFDVVCRALLTSGDEVVVETPFYGVLSHAIATTGARCVPVPLRADGVVDVDAVAQAMTERTAAIVVTNLQNPTGALIGESTLVALDQLCAGRGATLIVDEVYADFAREPEGGSAAALGEATVAVSSLTKVYGLSSLSCGWIVTSEATLPRIRQTWSRTGAVAGGVAHAMAALVVADIAPFDAHWRACLAATRPAVDEAHAHLVAAGVIEDAPLPDHGCIALLRLQRDCVDTRVLASALLERGVAITPGDFFGAPGSFRIGWTGRPEVVRTGLERLVEALPALTRA